MSRSRTAAQVTFEEFLDMAISTYESVQYSGNYDAILYAVGESLKINWNKPTKQDLKMIFDLWKNKQLLAVMGKFALLGMEDH